MRLARMVTAGAVLMVIGPAAWAQEARTGTVTLIDRINGSIAIQQTQSGTVGANSAGAAEQFKADRGLLEPFHAGDKVKFSVGESGMTKTITKLEKQ